MATEIWEIELWSYRKSKCRLGLIRMKLTGHQQNLPVKKTDPENTMQLLKQLQEKLTTC